MSWCSFCDEQGHTKKGCLELKAYTKYQASLPIPKIIHIGRPNGLGMKYPYLCNAVKVTMPNKCFSDEKFINSLPICEVCAEVYQNKTGKRIEEYLN